MQITSKNVIDGLPVLDLHDLERPVWEKMKSVKVQWLDTSSIPYKTTTKKKLQFEYDHERNLVMSKVSLGCDYDSSEGEYVSE